ncbi:ABC transporter substrate-binding protein [Herbivorax sp. ANBcel31]|uniref:ABC transporter substrate-binding protein n=1 Tax=Herbivorax sp. ANBcel31 TaxID=3069754 RepID=UPI0027B58091|nr:ABC transporter substrate-binding protein [Herbivorax sp. ANBcel31]MDQ2085582.1 ABC transporter substrate-binding protein [Herbivorax sp. ANBcel31]
MKSKKFLKFAKQLLVLSMVFIMIASFIGCSSGDAKGEDTSSGDASSGDAVSGNYRVGILSGLSYLAAAADGFKDELEKLGYVEGENIEYQILSTESDMEEYKNFSEKFVEDEVDLVFCYPTEAAIVLQEVTEGTDIPVVFGVTNIEGTDLVESVREPGGNLTGVRYPGPDLAIKRLEIMTEIVPDAKRILLPYSSEYPVCYPQLEELPAAAEEFGVTLIEAPAKTPQDLEDIFNEYDSQDELDFDAIVSIAEMFAVNPDTFLTMITFANRHEIPMGGALMEFEGYSSLFGVNINEYVTGQRAAGLADRILQGEDVSTMPVISDESFIQINYKEIQEQGLDVPENVLNEAEEIIR